MSTIVKTVFSAGGKRMKKLIVIGFVSTILLQGAVWAQDPFETDVIADSGGDIEITFIGHGTLMITYADTVIHVDPWTKLADYRTFPKADIVLVTHEHRDHLDTLALNLIRTDGTTVIMTESCEKKGCRGIIMKNGDTRHIGSISIEAVPAYNIVHKRTDGTPFHPKGIGNGYIITLSDKRIYIAGDTENIPEMKALENIDVAFLPMNLPYTMTPEMVADAALAFKPAVLYPYHFGETDTSIIVELLKDAEEIEVRIRRMK
jgi:L-ascorbate metabolism protein UlaG (beta-lactamase superfamily)